MCMRHVQLSQERKGNEENKKTISPNQYSGSERKRHYGPPYNGPKQQHNSSWERPCYCDEFLSECWLKLRVSVRLMDAHWYRKCMGCKCESGTNEEEWSAPLTHFNISHFKDECVHLRHCPCCCMCTFSTFTICYTLFLLRSQFINSYLWTFTTSFTWWCLLPFHSRWNRRVWKCEWKRMAPRWIGGSHLFISQMPGAVKVVHRKRFGKEITLTSFLRTRTMCEAVYIHLDGPEEHQDTRFKYSQDNAM